jgi:peroxin-16
MNTLVKAYENLLVDNVGTVRSVESGLRNLTWLLPGRFEDADVASEGRMSSLLKFIIELMD